MAVSKPLSSEIARLIRLASMVTARTTAIEVRSIPNALHGEWDHTDQPVGAIARALAKLVRKLLRRA
jgi:hypothetical protein